MKGLTLSIALLSAAELVPLGRSFSVAPPTGSGRPRPSALAALTDADGRPIADADRFNVPLERAAELWTCSVQESNNADRLAGVPYLASKSKDYFVDDVDAIEVAREGGLGMELLELAGGRDDGVGITIVSGVTPGGNAAKAGILPGDAVASVTVIGRERTTAGAGAGEETTRRVRNCEARDFDGTIDALANFPGDDAAVLYLDVKRMRRWPKVRVRVEYPPSQCDGWDGVEDLELFAGENLKRALQNRGIVMDDPGNPICDYCGSNACYVSVEKGGRLLNPMGLTEEKLMQRNPKVRLSCKCTVGHDMQEGDLSLRVNLSQWSTKE